MPTEVLATPDGPCLVCGTAGGNCTGESGPPDKILGEDLLAQPIRKATVGFVVAEHVYRQVQVTPKRQTTLLRYHKGQVITLAQAQEAGLA